MFAQNCPSARVLVLLGLISVTIASQVDSSSLKDLFSQEKSYERVANDLYESTSSGGLKDDPEIVSVLNTNIGEQSRSYHDLLIILGEDNQLCNAFSLETLRQLAEAMAAQGNLGPKKITEPIRRVNRIIIKQIIRARAVCFGYLAKQFPNPWKDALGWPRRYKNLSELDSLSHSLLLDNQANFNDKQLKQAENSRESCVLVATNSLLRSYADLLMASHIIDPESKKLAEFYTNDGERNDLKPVEHPNKELEDNAYRLRACDLLAARTAKTN